MSIFIHLQEIRLSFFILTILGVLKRAKSFSHEVKTFLVQNGIFPCIY